jgi:hypothetical protein
MKAFVRIILTICWLSTFKVSAQIATNTFDLEEFIERNFSVQDDDTNYEDIYEAFYQLYQHPLNLNKANRQELQSLLLLDQLQINAFLKHRAETGNLLSIYELQAIPYFDLQTIYALLPFVRVDDLGLQADNRPLLKRILSEPNNYLLLRADRAIQDKRGYTVNEEGEVPYAGSPYRLYSRFRVSHSNDFSIGFTTEKDAGEAFTWDETTKRYGMDYYSLHFQLMNKGKWKNIVLGDYQIQFGQSLLLGAGFSIGKGSETVATARRSNLGIKPYTGVLETNFFRGLAATYALTPQLDLTTFFSFNTIDGGISSDTTQSFEEYFTSIRLSGFHRTESEIAAKNAVEAQTLGANLLFENSSGDLNIGLTYLNTHYTPALQRRPSKYNQFEFNGDFNQNLGLFANYYWRNFHFFGETAISHSKGVGAVGGFIAALSPTLQTSIVARHYARDFHTFYGTAFGENTRAINEQGIYWGLKATPFKAFTITAYYDRFRFPWLRFRADAPTHGNESLLRLHYRFSRQIQVYGQFRIQNKEENVALEDRPELFTLQNGQKKNYILNLDIKPKGVLSLKSRLQFSEFTINEQYTNGLALIQDVNADFGKLRLSTRFAIFDTDNYINRQYVYEKDVLYAFSIPAYQNTGTRSYILLQYNMNKMLSFWIRWAEFRFLDTEEIGSGNETIEGSRRSDLKAQIRIRF